MATSNQILQKIQEKESAKAKALEDVAILDLQIKTLTSTLEMLEPTEYEQYLHAKASESPVAQPVEGVQEASVGSKPSSTTKNTKGALTPVILDVAADGKVRTIDEMLEDVNAKMEIPTTRDSVRATLNNLKSIGKLQRPEYGKYQGVNQKGESPADVVATNDNGGALNVQLSPLAGRQ